MLGTDEAVLGTGRTDQLVDLGLDGAVAVLRILVIVVPVLMTSCQVPE